MAAFPPAEDIKCQIIDWVKEVDTLQTCKKDDDKVAHEAMYTKLLGIFSNEKDSIMKNIK